MLEGLHHVTAIAGEPGPLLGFYRDLLGLRLIKRTVNFDDPGTWHLYFGDAAGSPGTAMTFFLWPGAPRGRLGSGQVTATSFAVPAEALSYWAGRLEEAKVAFTGPHLRFSEAWLAFRDPDGLPLELVARADFRGFIPPASGVIPVEAAIRGFSGVTLAVAEEDPTLALLRDALGLHELGREADRIRLASGADGTVAHLDVSVRPDLPRGVVAVGQIHHVALATGNEASQYQVREAMVAAGLHPTGVIDRRYFRSVYAREPGGVLLEVATLGPGFTVDEPLEHLGERLVLPPWHEARRAELERTLPPLE